MKWLLGVYTKRFNIRHKTCGHLFAGRYKALIVDGSGTGYLRTVCDYVHLNPVRASIIDPQNPLEHFSWSSYPEYLKPSAERPSWLRVDRLFGEKSIPIDSISGRKEFALQMELRRAEETGQDYHHLRQDWCLGTETFRAELLASAAERVGPNHYGSNRRQSLEEKAERIVAEELKRLDWAEPDLLSARKGDARKIAVARRLRKETVMTFDWIAQRLRMGSWSYVSNLLGQNPQSTCVNSED